jgi:zinc transporter ZupT
LGIIAFYLKEYFVETIKIISALVIFAVAIMSGIYPFLKKIQHGHSRDFPIGESISVGVFLGAGLLHMLPESAHGFSDFGYEYPFSFLLAGCTFFVLLHLEHLGNKAAAKGGANAIVFIATIMLSIHGFLAGAALGLTESTSLALVIFLAIIGHKWAESFSLSIKINKSILTRNKGILLFGAFALMTPLGIFIGSIPHDLINNQPLVEPIFSALAAGTFIYLGTVHGFSHSALVKLCCKRTMLGWVLFGFFLMAGMAAILNH